MRLRSAGSTVSDRAGGRWHPGGGIVPFIIVKANRIAAGEARTSLTQLLAQPVALVLLALLVATALAALVPAQPDRSSWHCAARSHSPF